MIVFFFEESLIICIPQLLFCCTNPYIPLSVRHSVPRMFVSFMQTRGNVYTNSGYENFQQLICKKNDFFAILPTYLKKKQKKKLQCQGLAMANFAQFCIVSWN